MIKEREVRPEECICESCSGILPNWKDILHYVKFRLTRLI